MGAAWTAVARYRRRVNGAAVSCASRPRAAPRRRRHRGSCQRDEADETVQQAYARVRERVWDADEGDDDDDALARLTPLERALYVTRELEEELADGGWYLVFANEDDYLIPHAVEAYELLGLPEYAKHFREVQDSAFGDESSEDESDRLDRAYAALSGAEAARVREIAAGQQTTEPT